MAEELEAGAAVHLPFEHLDLVDGAFGLAVVPLGAECGGDGVVVAADAVGEGGEGGQAAGVGCGEPAVEALGAGAVVGDLGEVADEGVEPGEVGAAGGDGGEGCGVVFGEVGGAWS